MLEVSGLSVSYGAHRALEDVAIEVRQGEICVILGANGAGKTSLLKAVAGLVKCAPGATVEIDGEDISGARPHEIVKAGVALVPEGRGVFAELTVGENLQLGAFGKQARGRRAELLERVLALFPRLAERRNQTVRTMSGGEQQMVAIGRALMSNPSILMLDEPSLGLSPILTKELFRLLRGVADGGVGILLVEQNARQSLDIADRGYLLENGRIIGEGSGARLARDPSVQAAFLGGAGYTNGYERRRGHEISRLMASVMASPKSDGSPAALAERAALIQRAYVDAERQRNSVDLLLATHARFAQPRAGSGHAWALGHSPADDIARKAGELAERASQIQRAFVAAQRDHASGLEPAAEAPAAKPGSRKAAARQKDAAGGKRGASNTMSARKAGTTKKTIRRRRGRD